MTVDVVGHAHSRSIPIRNAGLLEPNLQVLKLDGNLLRSIRRTLLERGTKAVLNYVKEKLPTE